MFDERLVLINVGLLPWSLALNQGARDTWSPAHIALTPVGLLMSADCTVGVGLAGVRLTAEVLARDDMTVVAVKHSGRGSRKGPESLPCLKSPVQPARAARWPKDALLRLLEP